MSSCSEIFSPWRNRRRVACFLSYRMLLERMLLERTRDVSLENPFLLCVRDTVPPRSSAHMKHLRSSLLSSFYNLNHSLYSSVSKGAGTARQERVCVLKFSSVPRISEGHWAPRNGLQVISLSCWNVIAGPRIVDSVLPVRLGEMQINHHQLPFLHWTLLGLWAIL